MADQINRKESVRKGSTEQQSSTLGNLLRSGSRSTNAGSLRSQGGADDYRNRLRKERGDARESEQAGLFYSFATVGSGSKTVHPPSRVNPDKINDNTDYAFNGESWWQIERIYAARTDPFNRKSPTRQVLVKWIGWPKPTWEPLRHFVGKAALVDFTERHGDPEMNNGPADVYERWFTC